MNKEDYDLLWRLITEQRWAALATTQEAGAPYVSFVAYAVDPGFSSVVMHLSRLATHTGFLLARPQVALGISAPDSGQGDPQILPRVTLEGRVAVIERENPAYQDARASYLERLPSAERLFGFGDFILFRMEVETLRYVGGFARAHNVDGARLRAWAREAGR